MNTLRVAKPERAAMIESILINMMRSGQLGGKISEDEFVSLLNRVPTTESSSIKVSVSLPLVNVLTHVQSYQRVVIVWEKQFTWRSRGIMFNFPASLPFL